jgi:hypothetical protein
MKNHIAFKSQYLTPHEFVLSIDSIEGVIDTGSSPSQTSLKLNSSVGSEIIIEHTSNATLQAEFANNIRKALIAKPGVGKIKVQLPEGFEVTFVDYA